MSWLGCVRGRELGRAWRRGYSCIGQTARGPTHHRPPPHGKWRDSRLCLTMPDVLTPEECAAFIDRAEAEGFHKASINYGNGVIRMDEEKRNSERCFIRSHAMAEEIWGRIKSLVPGEKAGREVLGIDPDLRLLKYTAGNFFRRHKDGPTIFDDGSRSYFTVVLYLNEDFQGGETELFDDSGNVSFRIKPTTGTALVHDHDIEHAALDLQDGVRYAMRTVLMYKPRARVGSAKPS